MKPLKDLGYLKVGMTLVDHNGKEGTVTGLYNDSQMDDFLLVEINNSPHRVMWDWGRVHPKLMVKENKQ